MDLNIDADSIEVYGSCDRVNVLLNGVEAEEVFEDIKDYLDSDAILDICDETNLLDSIGLDSIIEYLKNNNLSKKEASDLKDCLKDYYEITEKGLWD